MSRPLQILAAAARERAERLEALRADLQAEFDQLHAAAAAHGRGVHELVRLWSPTTYPPNGLDLAAVLDRLIQLQREGHAS